MGSPLCLFTENSFHGGCWRAAYKFSSLGAPALIGFVFYAFVVSPYLFIYNMCQAVGWARALATVLTSSRIGLWGLAGPTVTFYQHLGLLEVVHAVTGLTRSSPALTLMQMVSRFYVVALLNGCPQQVKRDSTWIPMMLCAWCVADFTRYVFYCFNLLRDIAGSCKSVAVALKMMKVKSVERADDPVFKIPFPLVWIRYSLFLVLYPTGVLGELMCAWTTRECMLHSMAVAQPGTLTAYFMSSIKFIFGSFGILRSETVYLITMLVIYIVGLPPLYLSLLGARKKQLAPPPKTDKAKKQQ